MSQTSVVHKVYVFKSVSATWIGINREKCIPFEEKRTDLDFELSITNNYREHNWRRFKKGTKQQIFKLLIIEITFGGMCCKFQALTSTNSAEKKGETNT